MEYAKPILTKHDELKQVTFSQHSVETPQLSAEQALSNMASKLGDRTSVHIATAKPQPRSPVRKSDINH